APTVYDQLGTVEQRTGNRSTNNAPRNIYPTSDSSWVAVSTSAQSIAERVLRLVGHPEVIDESWFANGRGRVEHVDLLDTYVGDWIVARTRSEVLEAFEQAGAAIAPVYDAKDLTEDPHVRATEMLTTVDDDELGPMLMHNVMWRMSESPGQIRHTGRALGADTESVLEEFGYTAAQRTALRDGGVIA
ncbi:MAG: CoA transferase, partial [Mycobacteriaceae bacterium]